MDIRVHRDDDGHVLALLQVLVVAASVASSPAGARPTFQRPYRESANNLLYNLLFCDDAELFRGAGAAPPAGALAVLLSADAPIDDLRRIAQDQAQESRLRILAFNALRSKGVKVPARQVLGVVVEVSLDGGLDTLAVFDDGRMRYINHVGKVAVFEATPQAMEQDRRKLMQAAREAVAKIGPWDKPRRPPPGRGGVRLTFLVSDGLYFGEGRFATIQRDSIGGPVLDSATRILLGIVAATTK